MTKNPRLRFEKLFLTNSEVYRETQSFTVHNGQSKLGAVAFYPQWRTYVFAPWPMTLFDFSCLTEISDFINQLNEERKNELQTRNQKDG